MKALVVYKNKKERTEIHTNKLIEKYFNVTYTWRNHVTKKHTSNADLIITLGGDGTVLSASHYLINKPILTVNSSPNTSEGVLTKINITQLEQKLKEIQSNNFKTEKLERIEVSINNKSIDLLSLNEVFIANEKAYRTSKYKIKFKNIEEEHRSSGLIFSTGTGSTAWFKSSHGEPFSPQSKFIKMIVREPYIGRIKKFSLLNAQIDEDEEFEVTPLVPSVLAIDSIKEIKLKKNDKVKIKISKHPLIRII